GLRCAEAESMRKPMIRLSFRTPLMLAASYALFAAAPPGWFLAGSAPRSYETGVDQTVTYAGMPSAVLKSVSPVPPQGFGTMMQTIQAGDYRGKRIRFSAEVKSDSVADWAGLWMRVDEGKQVTAFDNMQHRPIKGSTNWNPYTVVLDVSKGATAISFGILLAGPGSVWLSDVKFEVVDDQTPVTGPVTPAAPANLDFEKN